MSQRIKSILIVGGGTAGWLAAAVLAAKHAKRENGVRITLIEAPDIPIIGVGEGTWPSLRATLRAIGDDEAEFLRECQASYKQGSKFVGWKDGGKDDWYYHPFDLPEGFGDVNLAQHWLASPNGHSFSETVCAQERLCEAHRAPKLPSSPGYAGVTNYGYHLNAGLFSEFIKRHAVDKLGVQLVLDRVVGVGSRGDGDIDHVVTDGSGKLQADLFIDCTGFRSLLLGEHYDIALIDHSRTLPVNKALAVQVPYVADEPIRSATVATAQSAGWVWDIGLYTRRGVGYVYSSDHVTDLDAESELRSYLCMDEAQFDALEPRKIPIAPGFRQKFWHKNCVAIGLSAGFLEPLEASAIMLAEASAHFIADQLPVTRAAMDVIARRFNRRFRYRWERVIDFLKLHYALTSRTEPFWMDAAAPETWSERLTEDLTLWREQAPWKSDFDSLDEAFPAASYQYVLYGMGYATQTEAFAGFPSTELAGRAVENVQRNSTRLSNQLLDNRGLLDILHGA